jgi:signal transduction histidine kinase
MDWLKSRYTYVLIVLSLLVSTALQVMWLQQIFVAQQKQLRDDIEQIVIRTSQTNMYQSLTQMRDPGNIEQIKHMFLSPQWGQLRVAFENMKIKGARVTLGIMIDKDSTSVNMNFTMRDSTKAEPKGPISTYTGMTREELAANERKSLAAMKKTVQQRLRNIGINTPVYYNIYVHHSPDLKESTVLKGLNPIYTSRQYNYNIQSLYKYQLVLPSINYLVWYRMRYYLGSSLFMIALTCLAFYFILRLLRKQQLYADAKADFTSNMTHEFKTPIATVSVALESIQKYNLINKPETLQSYLNISQHELHRLDLMVEKVLKISNGDEAEQPLSLELFDLQPALQQVIASMQVQLANGPAQIQFHPSAEPCFVYGDPFQLNTVFYNLIDNAIKYSGSNLLLHISCSCNADQVLLNFKDNGPGIEPIYQQDVFERFYRIPTKGEVHNSKGSGLGLHYVKQLVEKHGGSIKLKSEPGAGSNFIITLPAAS